MKQRAKQAFNQLAEAYLVASNNSPAAKVFVNDLRSEHNYALNDYFFAKSNQEHSKKALRNDVKGITSK